MVDLRQTPEYALYLQSIGWNVEKLGNNNIFIKKFPVVGSIAKIQRPSHPVTMTRLIAIKNKYKTRIVYVEPFEDQVSDFRDLGFWPYNQPFLPSATIQIDLRKSEKVLLSEMKPKTRYNIKLASKNNLTVTRSNDIKRFSDFWGAQARRRKAYISENKFITKLFEAFGDKSIILSAQRNGTLVSELLLLRTTDTIYYMYAAANDEGRKLYAPTLLTWEAIRMGKYLKLERLDFDGIYDERFPLPAWKGFTRFKKGFGGVVVQYPGAFRKFTFI